MVLFFKYQVSSFTILDRGLITQMSRDLFVRFLN
jgi:hypothetical protein